MSNLNMNKIAAAILCAGLIGMVTGKVTEYLYLGGPEHHGKNAEKPVRGYTVEVTEAPAGGDASAPAGAADITPLFATADVKAGGDLFAKKCTVCHNGEKGAANKIGPHLYGVVNRKVASIADFSYSSGMKSHGDRTWTFDELNHFLYGPGKWVPGTMMSFPGFTKDTDRANVIAYLNSNSDSPAKLPTGSAKPPEKAAAAAVKADKTTNPASDASAGKTGAADKAKNEAATANAVKPTPAEGKAQSETGRKVTEKPERTTNGKAEAKPDAEKAEDKPE